MSRRDIDWDALRAEWLYNADAASGTAFVERQMRAARRGAFGEEVIGSGIAATALAFVGLALRHAANRVEAALGIVVGAAICFIWLRRRDLARQEQRSLEARAADYLRIIRVVRQRQARLAQFIWAVIALDLVFLIPWWVIGSRVHSRRLGDIGSIETMWLPLLGMALLGAWAARMRRRALREAAAIARMQRSVWADVD